jgi:hypothetical protein
MLDVMFAGGLIVLFSLIGLFINWCENQSKASSNKN